MYHSISAARLVRSVGLCLLFIFPGSCGSDRRNPSPPAELFSVDADDTGSSIVTQEISVLNSSNAEPNLPVDTSSGTIIYTPAEEIKKVPILAACTASYQISAATNPFLAGMPSNSEIVYPLSIDRSPVNGPTRLLPTDTQCMKAGRALYFSVEGKIAFGDLVGQESNADGQSTKVVQHTLGSVNHIAAPLAPINSLIGLFLDATPTQMRTSIVASLDFTSSSRRDFKTLSPLVGQIFFIGDGKDSLGGLQAFVVPPGATRLYVAIMDEYEWNNNLGKLTVSAAWQKP